MTELNDAQKSSMLAEESLGAINLLCPDTKTFRVAGGDSNSVKLVLKILPT